MIEFDEATHTYKLDGVLVKSVTQILEESGLSDFSRVPPDVLKRACEFGSAVHSATELDDMDDLDDDSLDPSLFPYLAAWRKFKREFGFQVIDMEQIVYSKKLLFAGTYDRKGILNDKLTVLDIKTGIAIKSTVRNTGVQLAGYAIGYDEERKIKEQIKSRVGIWLKDTGEYQLERFKNKRDYFVFRAALTIVNFKGGRYE